MRTPLYVQTTLLTHKHIKKVENLQCFGVIPYSIKLEAKTCNTLYRLLTNYSGGGKVWTSLQKGFGRGVLRLKREGGFKLGATKVGL